MTRNVLVHACCGPCSLEPVRLLREEGFEPTIAWSNPNIQPAAEYDRRLQTLLGWAADEGLEVLQVPHDRESAELWERAAAPRGFDREARCRACYALRLSAAADLALARGFSTLTTTLAVSPYQLHDLCDELLEKIAASRGLEALVRDWRPRYPEAVERARELGLYRQNYCGCRFSAAEAQAERIAAREARKAAREAERARAGRTVSPRSESRSEVSA